jgi:hypothetical protein
MTKGYTVHTPGPCPVDPKAFVRARLEDGYLLMPLQAKEVDWNCPGDDVIEFKIVSGPEDFS